MDTTIIKAQRQVKEFHEKHGFPVDVSKHLWSNKGAPTLTILSALLLQLVEDNQEMAINFQNDGDPRLYRALLSMEELAEYMKASAESDLKEVADALADRLYVLLGDAVSDGLSLAHVFDEVHRSNMTKQPRDPNSNSRMRDKGPDFIPPDIMGAVRRGWVREEFEARLCNEDL